MVARYVMPEIHNSMEGLRVSQKYLIDNRQMFERAGQAVMKKIMENERAVAALAVTQEQMKAARASTPIPTTNAPDFAKKD